MKLKIYFYKSAILLAFENNNNDIVSLLLTHFQITKLESFFAYGNKNLKSINIPSQIIEIGESAFAKCEFLEEVNFPMSVTFIDERAFENCVSLKEISLPNISIIKQFSFNGCKSLQKVFIPPSVSTIEKYAFYECLSLKSVDIPATVENIGIFAFPQNTQIIHYKKEAEKK